MNKKFAWWAGWFVIAALCADVGSADHGSDTRPNILFILTDDQRWDAMGVVQKEQGAAARFPWLQTPNMDRLAADGVRFRNAFVVNSLCSPSRATFLTGQYAYRHGVLGNAEDFPVNHITCASLLTAAGYVTGYFGKWHMGEQRGQRPGFTTSASFVGHGKYFNCPFEVDGVRRETTGWVDTVVTDFAIDFLKQNAGKPFFAMVGFKTPHDHREPRPEDAAAYPEVTTAVPVSANCVPPFKPEQANPGKIPGKQVPLQPYDRQYFQTLNGADYNLGRLLDTLDALHLSENTMVIYTSDNGYFLGEHALGDKRYAYDESLRIPMLLRYPKLGLKGKVMDDVVLNLDFAQTALDFAGLPANAGMQGRSWKPLLSGAETRWRESFYYEYFLDTKFPKETPCQALRTPTAKLIIYPGHEEWTELFDLKNDPHETRNLVNEPEFAALLAQMKTDFIKAQQAAKAKSP